MNLEDEIKSKFGNDIKIEPCIYIGDNRWKNISLTKRLFSWPWRPWVKTKCINEPAVFFFKDSNTSHPSHNKWVVDDGGFRKECFTHKARLAFIEEIKKEPCKHEPEDIQIFNASGNYRFSFGAGISKCKYCGVELQATWSEKK